LMIASFASPCIAQENQIVLTPLIGDTLNAEARKYFGLFDSVESFDWAVFYLNSDSTLTAKLCRTEDGAMKFDLIVMGPIDSLRDELAARREGKTHGRRKAGKTTFSIGIGFPVYGPDAGDNSLTVAPKIELRQEAIPNLDLGISIDSYALNWRDNFIGILVLYRPPVEIGAFHPFVTYNLHDLEKLSHLLEVGVTTPFSNGKTMFRIGIGVILASHTEAAMVPTAEGGAERGRVDSSVFGGIVEFAIEF